MNFEEIKTYLQEIKMIDESLTKYAKDKELFDSEKLNEFRYVTDELKRKTEIVKSESRKLSIGVVGGVKAGKSSFLNACIFEGEEYLPRAATPMTAALTKISYSEKPKAIIHFYTSEDWGIIKEQAKKYQNTLNKEYNRYLDNIKNNKQYKKEREHLNFHAKVKSREEFEKSYICKSESQRGANEIMSMVTDPDLERKLGQTEEIEGDIISKLDDYIGVNGNYTPIVSYVELQVDNPYMKDFEIVDTPGLNDPIISRSITTKQFLRYCDVVILLSPCSQFMDANTVKMMANRLPSEGVNEILVIGSKLDSGILNEDSDSFSYAYKKSLESYREQFLKNLVEVKKNRKNLDILEKMRVENVLYVSAVSFSIAQKLKNNVSLDENEKVIYENLHKFKDFEDRYMASLGGITKVKKAINDIIKRKTEIIEDKNNGLLKKIKDKHARVLENILQESISSRTKLKTITVEELKQNTGVIKDCIDSSRRKLIHYFDGAIIKCDEKIQDIIPQIDIKMGLYQNFTIDKISEFRSETNDVGFLGLIKEISYYTDTIKLADTSEVISNIRKYSADCQTYINEEFKYIFNKEEFSKKIKDTILENFEKTGKEFDEDDILLPLDNVLLKISVPHIEIDYTKYIDEVESRFSEGYAKQEDIHKLNNLQSRLLNGIETEILEKLRETLKEIKLVLQEQAVTFADQVEKEFCTELEKLKKQIEEREYYIQEYTKLEEEVVKMKKHVSLSFYSN